MEKWKKPYFIPLRAPLPSIKRSDGLPSIKRSDGGTYISTFFTINEWSKQTKNLKDKVFGIHLPAFHA